MALVAVSMTQPQPGSGHRGDEVSALCGGGEISMKIAGKKNVLKKPSMCLEPTRLQPEQLYMADFLGDLDTAS